MDERTRAYLITGAVLVGSLGLFGSLTYGIVVTTVSSLAALAGATAAPSGLTGSAVRIGAVLVALQVATEVAAIQLHGFGALWRGSRRQRLARHLLLSAVVLAAVGLMVGAIVDAVAFGAATSDPTTVTLAGAVVAALLWVAVRSATAFGAGLAGEGLDAE